MSKLHEATYSVQLIDPIVELLLERVDPARVARGGHLLDPFGGTGVKLAQIAARVGLEPLAFEIEPGYVDDPATHPCVVLGDSTSMPLIDGCVPAAVTSPVYPNGMADNFRSSSYDDSRRHTYIHNLRARYGPGYALQPNNTAGVGSPRSSRKALARMYELHAKVWAEVFRVLQHGGVFVVNTKDTPKIPFTADTCTQLTEAGFQIVTQREVATPGHNDQQHADRKVRHEMLTVARKPPLFDTWKVTP